MARKPSPAVQARLDDYSERHHQSLGFTRSHAETRVLLRGAD